MERFLPMVRTLYTDTKQFLITRLQAYSEYKESCKKILYTFLSAVLCAKPFSTQFIKYIILFLIGYEEIMWSHFQNVLCSPNEITLLTTIQ
uniref:Uncharacterized protein n=1 Tax=Pyxicephalus adspersus TaxID=30357 RepID=A0AAV3BB69_PYXAD|nr:TPA: hypothetical protein GDO54_001243 [Pyxicephalus adspersus]